MKKTTIFSLFLIISFLLISLCKVSAQKSVITQPQIDIVAYPNPFNEGVSLEIVSLHAKATELRVFDIIGKECQKIELNPFGHSGLFRVVIHDLPPGVYFCNLYAEKKLLGSKKIVSLH